MSNSADRVLIVGAGLAGLCCAKVLQEKNVPFLMLESSESVGGRIKTDEYNGFLLDRGFQILLSAYPEARAVLDYEKLDLRPFYPGALVRSGSQFHKLSDPFRRPADAVETMLSRVGTISDKLRVASLRSGAVKCAPNVATMDALQEIGFSDSFIDKFFRPFFCGIFLEPKLETSSNLVNFLFSMFANGDNVLPRQGMQSIPQQIADGLPADSIRFNCAVEKIEGQQVFLENGEVLQGSSVVIATDEPNCSRLLGQSADIAFVSQTCMYFEANEPPIQEPVLVLNGDGEGIVNNFCVPSNVAPSYAPAGKALLSATIVGDMSVSEENLERAVRENMKDWFGSQVDSWKRLRTYRIKYALPDQRPAALARTDKSYESRNGVITCGDYKEMACINGAMVSGRKAAEAVLEAVR